MKGVKVRDFTQSLIDAGFEFIKHSKHGNVYKHADGRITTIGQHYKGGIIPAGTFKQIQKQTQL